MRSLRWLALVPLAIGLWALLLGVIWTEWEVLLLAAAFLTGAAAIWRMFAGAWPVRVT